MTTVRIVTDRFEQVCEQLVASLATNVAAELIERTPVDTGWARANWVPALGRASQIGGGRPPSDRDTRRSLARSRSGDQGQGTAQVATWKSGSGNVFITNNVPYIRRLNGGYSDQAPSGFVQAGIMAGIQSLQGQVFE